MQHGDADVNDSGRLLLQLCCNSVLCSMKSFFQHRDLHTYTWCRDSLGQRSLNLGVCIATGEQLKLWSFPVCCKATQESLNCLWHGCAWIRDDTGRLLSGFRPGR